MQILYRGPTVTDEEFAAFCDSAVATFEWVLKLENSGELPTGSDRQRTGCVVTLGRANGALRAAIALGDLPPEKTEEYLGNTTEKMQRTARCGLSHNDAMRGVKTPINVTSFQTAEPHHRMWGGNVRDESSDTSISTSGLSAFGDEAMSGGTGYSMERFSRDFVCSAMQISTNPFLSKFMERTSEVPA